MISADNKPDDVDQLLVLYRQTRRQQPPAELDRRILAAARETSVAKPLPSNKPHRSRWSVPLAMAATVVLGVGLVTLVQLELDQQTPMESSDLAPSSERLQNLNDPVPQQAPARSEITPRPAPKTQESALQMTAPPPPAPATPPVPAAARQAEPPAAALGESAPESESTERKIESARPAPAAVDQAEPLRSPDDWRDYILTLQEQGHIEQARHELQSLRAAYPDYLARFPGLE